MVVLSSYDCQNHSFFVNVDLQNLIRCPNMNKGSDEDLDQRAMAQVVFKELLLHLEVIIDQVDPTIRQNFWVNKAAISGLIDNSFI